jgi:hypothetical protein
VLFYWCKFWQFSFILLVLAYQTFTDFLTNQYRPLKLTLISWPVWYTQKIFLHWLNDLSSSLKSFIFQRFLTLPYLMQCQYWTFWQIWPASTEFCCQLVAQFAPGTWQLLISCSTCKKLLWNRRPIFLIDDFPFKKLSFDFCSLVDSSGLSKQEVSNQTKAQLLFHAQTDKTFRAVIHALA